MDTAVASEEETQPSPSAARWRTASWELHPLCAAVAVPVNLLLSGYEIVGGVFVVFAILTAITLVVPCAMIQKHAFGDSWEVALAKGVVVGLLTAVQGPVASVVTIALGVMGGLALRRRHRAQQPDVLDAHT